MSKLKKDDPEQSRRFVEIAEANLAERDVLKEAVKKIAAQPRAKEPLPKRARK